MSNIPIPVEDTSRLKTLIATYQVSVTSSAQQISGSIVNAANGFLENGVLAALGAAPPYLCRLIEISDATEQVYMDRSSSVTTSVYAETLAVGATKPVTFQAGESLPIWIIGAGSGTVQVRFYQ